MDPIFLRLLMYIYSNQKCTVKWCGAQSKWFDVKNGVRQGGISSGIFFAVYIDKLISILRRSQLGCHIQGIFYGILVYADDILLLSASRGGLQEMVRLCEGFVATRNLKFGTNHCCHCCVRTDIGKIQTQFNQKK